MSTTFEDIANINTAIYDTLKTVDPELLLYSQNYNDLREGVANFPMFQVYWQSGTVGSATDRYTYTAGLRISDLVFHVDLFADTRAQSDNIFGAIFPLLQKIDQKLSEQNTKPYFGLVRTDGEYVIKSYQYSYERATFTYEQGDGVTYPGVRFVINVRVF